MINKQLNVWLTLIVLIGACLKGQAAPINEHDEHLGHSDDLLILLGYKIKLQKLQSEYTENTTNLDQQTRLLQRAMPVLNSYMAKPKSYYLTTEMYHDSLENRAAMLTDFSDILVKYQKLLVSSR